MSKENNKKQKNSKNNEASKKVTNLKDTKAKKDKVIIEEEKVTEEERITEEEFEYNEDLDEDFEENEEEVMIVEVKKEEKKTETSKDKKESSKDKDFVKIEKVPSKKNIEKIEKMAKNKKKVKKSNSKFTEFMAWFEKNHVAIYSFIAGLVLTSLVAFIIWPDRIATLKSGEQSIVKIDKKNYTADDLYEDMKNYYSVSLLLDDIDNDVLTKLYPENDEMLEEVKANAQNYFDMYKQYYNYTEEQFLEQNGFSSYDAFLDYLKLDYRRNKYLDKYIEDGLKDKEIEEYYNENVFGDINTQHILVTVSDSESEDKDKKGLSDEDAKKLAEKIITKLNDGTSWEDVQKKYKDQITFEDLGYQSWDASLEESFMTALEDMDDKSYSEEPVKTSYGYHVIYRLDQKKKPSLKKSKDKIIDNMIADAKADDANLLYKALISLREDKNIKFNDTVMKDKYKKYCEQYEDKK